MQAYFTPQHTRCPIESYEIFDRFEDPMLVTSDVYTVLDLANYNG